MAATLKTAKEIFRRLWWPPALFAVAVVWLLAWWPVWVLTGRNIMANPNPPFRWMDEPP
jgi:hypothetical protein